MALEIAKKILKAYNNKNIFSTNDFYNSHVQLHPGMSEEQVGCSNERHFSRMCFKYGQPSPDHQDIIQFHGDIALYISLWSAIVERSKVGSCFPLTCWAFKQFFDDSASFQQFCVHVLRLKLLDHYVLVVSRGQQQLSCNPSQWPQDVCVLDLYARQCYLANDFYTHMSNLCFSRAIYPYNPQLPCPRDPNELFAVDTVFQSTIGENPLPQVNADQVEEIISTNNDICFFVSTLSPLTVAVAAAPLGVGAAFLL